ncbi:hypothetical protein [Radiobacillus kanasensis]|nr:hypothetical protein [Radiobacillus kanasensis]
MEWFFALCGFSLAAGALVQCEKNKKENDDLKVRIEKLEKKVYKA